MKIIARYKTRVLADDDHNYLLSQGIPSVVYGETGLQALKKHFKKAELIALAVHDGQAETALELLKKREKKLKAGKFI